MRKLLLVTVLAGAAIIGTFSLVSAHNRPVFFDPGPSAVLDSPPEQVTAWYAGPVRRDPNWTYLQVHDANGNRVDTDDLTISDDRRQVTVGLQPDLEPGIYMVTWRNWDDDDGHILGDCYRFFVGQEAADAAIAEGTRLLGGSDCAAIDIAARDGTPTAEQLTPTPRPENGATGGGASSDDDDGDDGVPVWLFIVGVIGGAAVGGAGGKLLGGRS